MFDPKECISISWDKDERVSGISLKRNAKKNNVTGHVFCDNKECSFSERLKYVNGKLYKNQNQFIVIGGYISSAVCMELAIPPLSRKDTAQYLYYELARRVPFPICDLRWCYRPLPSKVSKTERDIRIFAVLEKKWDEFLSEIMTSEIKVDSFVYPFMAVNQFFQSLGIRFGGIDEEFFLCSPTEIEGSCMKKRPSSTIDTKNTSQSNSLITEYFKDKHEELSSDNFENLLPSLILAEYCFTREYLKDRQFNIKIPNELQPKRFKSLKITVIVLFIAFVILSSLYVIRQRIATIKTLGTLANEKTLILNAIKENNLEYHKNQKYDKIAEEIGESIPKAIRPIKYLQALIKAIPSNIWITSFASNKDKVNVTLQTKSNAGNVVAALNKLQLFTTENVRKRKTGDGTQYIYLTLKPRSKISDS